MNNDEPSFKECGTFTDHGFGFHAQVGTRTDYIIGYPYENDGWAVLTGSYDLEDDCLDCHIPKGYLDGLLSVHCQPSLDELKAHHDDGSWREVITRVIAENQHSNRFEVPHYYPNHSSAARFCISQGAPADRLLPAMEKARSVYEVVKAAEAPEKAVSLKGEVETARGAFAAMADNGNHSNRGQDAR